MSDYKERLHEEQLELSDKLIKLDKFMEGKAFFELPFDKRNLLEQQCHAMRHYQSILRQRIALEEGWHEPNG